MVPETGGTSGDSKRGAVECGGKNTGAGSSVVARETSAAVAVAAPRLRRTFGYDYLYGANFVRTIEDESLKLEHLRRGAQCSDFQQKDHQRSNVHQFFAYLLWTGEPNRDIFFST
ncbi:hypothetical protein Fot_39130 [Forsythia ovata]|uniref:Uncharacterized protein n=1 Tax=Forsythia ovata TaxID=205694 RepID=A0ABD1S4K2_9LAMI